MYDYVRTMLTTGLDGLSSFPQLARLDRILFPDPSYRTEFVDRYMTLLRHPELYGFLTVRDSRLTESPADSLLPLGVPGLGATLYSDIDQLFTDHGVELFSAASVDGLESLYEDSTEGLLKLGAVLLCLAYAIGNLRMSDAR